MTSLLEWSFAVVQICFILIYFVMLMNTRGAMKMGLRKKKPEIIDMEDQKSNESSNKEPKSPQNPEISPYLKDLAEGIQKKYGDYFTPNDAAELPDGVWKSQVLILLAALIGEVKELQEIVKEE